MHLVLIAEGITRACAYFSNAVKVGTYVILNSGIGKEALEAEGVDRGQVSELVVGMARPAFAPGEVLCARHTTAQEARAGILSHGKGLGRAG